MSNEELKILLEMPFLIMFRIKAIDIGSNKKNVLDFINDVKFFTRNEYIIGNKIVIKLINSGNCLF